MAFNHVDEFFEKAEAYISVFDVWAKRVSPAAVADHICFKCGDMAEFERARALFEKDSSFIFQSIISGRRIAIIGLKQSLATHLGEIRLLELSDQKPDGSQVSGFDHIEIYPVTGTVASLADDLLRKGFVVEKIERPHHTTYDGVIVDDFKVRLESEPLLEKIKQDEMR